MARFGPARTQTRSIHSAKRAHSSPSSRGFRKTSPAAGWNRPYQFPEMPLPALPPQRPLSLRWILPARDPATKASSPAHTRNSNSSCPFRTPRLARAPKSSSSPAPLCPRQSSRSLSSDFLAHLPCSPWANSAAEPHFPILYFLYVPTSFTSSFNNLRYPEIRRLRIRRMLQDVLSHSTRHN